LGTVADGYFLGFGYGKGSSRPEKLPIMGFLGDQSYMEISK
jgi:hypothetical protein